MIGSCDEYIRYVAYANLLKGFKDKVDELGAKRPSVKTLLRIMNDVYDEVYSTVEDVTIDVDETFDTIAYKKERQSRNKLLLRDLYEASERFTVLLLPLERPTLNAVFKILTEEVDKVRAYAFVI